VFSVFPLYCCLVVSTSAIDCLERLVSRMTYCVSRGMLNPTHSVTDSDSDDDMCQPWRQHVSRQLTKAVVHVAVNHRHPPRCYQVTVSCSSVHADSWPPNSWNSDVLGYESYPVWFIRWIMDVSRAWVATRNSVAASLLKFQAACATHSSSVIR